MCGFLIYPEKPRRAVVMTHLNRQRHRGIDGFGAIALDTDNHRSCSGLFIKPFMNKFARLPRGGVIIHHRKASVGGIKESLVHPLISRDGKVKLMQNGTRRELASLFYEDSDSKALANMWNCVDDDALYCMLEGCGVTFTTDEGRLWFHKDEKRTLYKCTEGRMEGMFASEPMDAGLWALVDEYPLEELPMNVNDWHLEHGTPVPYTLKKCVIHACGEYYAGTMDGYRCVSCEAKFATNHTRSNGWNQGQGRQGYMGGMT